MTVSDPLYDVFTGPDTDVIATHVIESGKKAKKKKIPQKVQITNAITGVSVTDTMVGSSTLTITLVDPDYELIESGFFDSNADGRLDAIDLEYPDNSDNWWRVSQVGLSNSDGSPQLTLTCMERAAAHLASLRGPMKVSRGKRTRAEFLQSCAGKVKAGGGITFYSKEIHQKQKVKGGKEVTKDPIIKSKTSEEKKKEKAAGIHRDEPNLTVKGVKATKSQIEIANQGLSIAAELNAPEKASLALILAYIQESTITNLDHGDRDSLGVLQVRVSTSGSAAKSKSVEWCTKQFLLHGFWGKGGAIQIAKQSAGQGPGWVAQQAQGSGFPAAYQPHLPEAKKILEAFGGSGTTGYTSTTRKYNFEIGTAENPNEDLWAGMQRIAEEVKWPLFLNGQDMYYDSEMTLIKQQPSLILTRGAPSLVSYDFNWDSRNICTEFTMDLICDPNEFRAGQVIKLVDFGPASKGSTATPPLPGRWLISEIERDLTSLSSSFTLKQPQKPLREPAPETTSHSYGAAASDSGEDAGPVRDKIIRIAKASIGPYFYSQSGALTSKVHPGRGNRSDCSQWARACYLTAGAGDPGTYTGAMLARGKKTTDPKPGDLLCGASHVELYIGGDKTIGHGSDPIDEWTVTAAKASKPDMHFITFDFLDK